MKKALIKSLEDLLKEEDESKFPELKQSIMTHVHVDEERIMQSVNSYTDTQSNESRKALQRILESLSNS
jgi:hypothetical protein